MGEVAGPDSCRPILQRSDRRDHSASKEDAGQDREAETEHEDDGAPDDWRAQGRVRVHEWPLHEHEPPQRGDRRVRGQHSHPLQAVGNGDQGLVVRSGHASSLRRLHLWKFREVTVLLDEPRVGMGK